MFQRKGEIQIVSLYYYYLSFLLKKGKVDGV